MAEYIHLIGAEDVSRAGNSIRSAAEEMNRAASNMEDVMQRQRQFMDDWLIHFADVLEAARKETK